jgi:hypothetical protein
MNRNQKLMLILAFAIVAGMGIFPPWTRTDAFGISRYRGYSFLLHPPVSVADSLLANAPVRYSVDWVQLVKGWLCVAGISLPITILLRTRGKKTEGGLSELRT